MTDELILYIFKFPKVRVYILALYHNYNPSLESIILWRFILYNGKNHLKYDRKKIWLFRVTGLFFIKMRGIMKSLSENRLLLVSSERR